VTSSWNTLALRSQPNPARDTLHQTITRDTINHKPKNILFVRINHFMVVNCIMAFFNLHKLASCEDDVIRARRQRPARDVLIIGLMLLWGSFWPAGSWTAKAEQSTLSTGAPTHLTPPPEVRHVVERRCVVCHGCYDSPCQLNMMSGEGLLRGAAKTPVYDAQRLKAAQLTRLGIDGATTEDWRRLGFYSVGPDGSRGAIESSQIWNMLKLKRDHPLKADAPLPDGLPLKIDRRLSCPRQEEFADYAREKPMAGMPYALAPLSDGETKTLTDWLKDGSPMSEQPMQLSETLREQISEWEKFLNGGDAREKLVARYLYEHLYLAHLYFEDGDASHFFRIVRSMTPPGAPVKQIASRRPYDDPGIEEFYYRLAPITETLLRKTHITYRLSPDRLTHIRNLFLHADWSVDVLPSYEPAIASNPFKAYAAIPAASRYEFLLDDALFFIKTFIHGPSCRGQAAVDVIDDRFWVIFLSPDADLSVADPAYLKGAMEYLGLPAELANAGLVRGASPAHLAYHRLYIDYRKRHYREHSQDGLGFELKDIWDGGKVNTNAFLTVFRHFDSASVVTGFIGVAPKTAWLIDFPTLERIYYNLVAGFDVYGNVEHQLGTRLYMDLLRMDSEAAFLEFLPTKDRRRLQESWYGGVLAKTLSFLEGGRVDIQRETRIPFKTQDTKAELLLMTLARGEGRQMIADPINRCETPPCANHNAFAAQQEIQKSLQKIAHVTGRWVQETPELSLLRIRAEEGQEENKKDAIYSLIHNRAHSNVAFIFFEDMRLQPAKDDLTVYPGVAGSYPNFYFDVTRKQLPSFVKDLKSVTSANKFNEFTAKYGVRRSSPKFWEVTDAFQDALKHQDTVEAGLLDLNRYIDPNGTGDTKASMLQSRFTTSALMRIMKRAKAISREMVAPKQ
jgi:hypothetical protein